MARNAPRSLDMPNTGRAVSNDLYRCTKNTHTLFGAIDELLDCGDTVVRHVVVVGHGVETRARSSLVGRARCDELVIALVAHVLSRSIKRWNAQRCLPLLIGSGGLCLLAQVLHDAWVGIGEAGKGQGSERGGLHVGSM